MSINVEFYKKDDEIINMFCKELFESEEYLKHSKKACSEITNKSYKEMISNRYYKALNNQEPIEVIEDDSFTSIKFRLEDNKLDSLIQNL